VNLRRRGTGWSVTIEEGKGGERNEPVDGSLGKHGVVLNLGPSERGSVLGEQDELG